MRDTLDLGAWCILRMGSASTLSVHDSLKKAGFDVWTPVERKTSRMPLTRGRFEKQIAMTPSYVFAHVQHLEDLMRMAMTPQREHPRFTMFKHQGGFPLIADDDLEALRAIEDKRHSIFEKLKRKGEKGPEFGRGAPVKLTEGPFAGFSGIVDGGNSKFTFVNIVGFPDPVKISSLLLLPDVAINESSNDSAAQEAA